MTSDALRNLIKFWEDEASSCEEELDNALSHCRYYYKLLDDLKDAEEIT